mgnify:CR=1 FL=1|jgi:transcription elongation factor Elf1|tara:strand:- start:1107 stop:1295 length:189 start_codon:yes stop_codon:yes gene_type:complete
MAKENSMTRLDSKIEAAFNDCPECDGTGIVTYASLNDDIPLTECNNCGGNGYVEMDELDWLD